MEDLRAYFNKKKVEELRNDLIALNERKTGSKPELVNRLMEYATRNPTYRPGTASPAAPIEVPPVGHPVGTLLAFPPPVAAVAMNVPVIKPAAAPAAVVKVRLVGAMPTTMFTGTPAAGGAPATAAPVGTVVRDYSMMKVDELKDEIRRRNAAGAKIKLVGAKGELQERLREHDRSGNGGSPAAAQQGIPVIAQSGAAAALNIANAARATAPTTVPAPPAGPAASYDRKTTVPVLKEILRGLNLPVSGKKDDLLDRLDEFYGKKAAPVLSTGRPLVVSIGGAVDDSDSDDDDDSEADSDEDSDAESGDAPAVVKPKAKVSDTDSDEDSDATSEEEDEEEEDSDDEDDE